VDEKLIEVAKKRRRQKRAHGRRAKRDFTCHLGSLLVCKTRVKDRASVWPTERAVLRLAALCSMSVSLYMVNIYLTSERPLGCVIYIRHKQVYTC
jgi:hypothetical protein